MQITSAALPIGGPAPNFQLLGVDGKEYSLETFKDKKVLVIIFSCNHCPYVQAYEGRMIQIQKNYVDKGAQFALINSNEDQNYPEDSFEEMVKRAKIIGYPFPYLRDESQGVAKAYRATHTPHLFVFDQERYLRYTGKIDDNHQNPQAVQRHYLREALDALLSGKEVLEPSTHAIGCTIKWKRS